MTDMRRTIAELSSSIESLLVRFPELQEDVILRADMFEAETDIDAVLMKLVDMERTADAMSDGIQLYIEELEARQQRYGRRKEAARELIQAIMDRADLKKRELPTATLSVSYRKPAPVVVDETALPDEFCKFKRSPDMAKIKEAETLPPGVVMGNGREVLTVRTK